MANDDSSARDAQPEPRDEGTRGGSEGDSSCSFCLEGWVFLGSIGPEGEELYEAIRCRRCCGTGREDDRVC